MTRKIAYLFSLVLWLMVSCNTPPTLSPPIPPDGPTLEIALLSPNSGEMLTFGRLLRQGSLMAFEQWNQQGGLLGHRITWRVYDTECTFEGAINAAKQAVADGVQFMIGPMCTAAAMGAATVADSENVIMITPTATHPLVTVEGWGRTRPTVFRAVLDYNGQAEHTASFAYHYLQYQQAAILTHQPNNDSQTMGDRFAEQFLADGGEIIYQAMLTGDEADMETHLTTIAATEAEFIYLPVSTTIANQIADQRHELDLMEQLTLLGSDQWQPDTLDPTLLNQVYFPAHYTPSAETEPWAETYKALFAIEPDTLAFFGYEAADLLLTAIHQTNDSSIEAVTATLQQHPLSTTHGIVTFNKQHNPNRPLPFMTIRQNEIQFETVWPLSDGLP